MREPKSQQNHENQETLGSRYSIVDMSQLPPCDCPCGTTRRAFTDDPQQIASLHLVEIKEDSQTHYHRRLTEIYYVLEGEGYLELDDQRFAVSAGFAVLIKPGCRHRAVGKMKILNIPIPAFDPDDEWFDT